MKEWALLPLLVLEKFYRESGNEEKIPKKKILNKSDATILFRDSLHLKSNKNHHNKSHFTTQNTFVCDTINK